MLSSISRKMQVFHFFPRKLNESTLFFSANNKETTLGEAGNRGASAGVPAYRRRPGQAQIGPRVFSDYLVREAVNTEVSQYILHFRYSLCSYCNRDTRGGGRLIANRMRAKFRVFRKDCVYHFLKLAVGLVPVCGLGCHTGRWTPPGSSRCAALPGLAGDTAVRDFASQPQA